MHAWLITIGEPLPTDAAGSERLLRTGLLAQRIVHGGHRVDFWSSTFDHSKKRHRFDRDLQIGIQHGYRLCLLHANRYDGNVSLRRVLNHRMLAAKFLRHAASAEKPDVILCSLPTLELCEAATIYGREFGVPVVIDVRDLWPDLLAEIVPRPFRPLAQLGLHPMRRQAFRACTAANAITGVTGEYVDWGLSYARRRARPLDRSFPMGYPKMAINPRAEQDAIAYWSKLGITQDSNEFIASWFGVMGRHSEIATVIRAAQQLRETGRRVKFVICGVGPAFERCRRIAANCDNILFPGWVNAAQIQSLLAASSVGLAPYVSNDNFRLNIPNKPIEYLSAGLPVVSSLQGLLAELLEKHDCGITYANAQPDQLASAIANLCDHPRRRQELARNARTLYDRQYVADQVYDSMVDYLLAVAGQSADSAAEPALLAA